MSDIKTFDGASLALKKIERYPEGSLSPRDVLTTILVSGDKDELAYKLNSVITAAIYQRAEDYIKANPQPERRQGFTPVSDMKVKADDREARAKALSDAVLNAISKYTESSS